MPLLIKKIQKKNPRYTLLGALEKGQALLIVILVILIALTIILSLASRGITSLRTSTEEADSQKALAAAEAGVERALREPPGGGPSGSGFTDNNSTYEIEVTAFENDTFLVNGGNLLVQNEGADVWLAEHKPTEDIKYDSVKTATHFNLYWGDASENCTTNPPAAIQVIAIGRNKTTNEVKSYRYAYDPCSRGNNFTNAESVSTTIAGSSGSKTFSFRTPDNPTDPIEDLLLRGVSDIVFMRVVPIYKDTVVGVSACDHGGGSCVSGGMPVQGFDISSTGESGETKRKILAFKAFPQTYLPFLSYGLFVPK